MDCLPILRKGGRSAPEARGKAAKGRREATLGGMGPFTSSSGLLFLVVQVGLPQIQVACGTELFLETACTNASEGIL